MQKNNPACTRNMRLATYAAPLWRYSIVLFCALLVSGCSRENQPTKPVANNDSGLTVLNEGYSMLYQDLDGLSGINKLLYVKLETDAVDRVISAIADTAAKHVKALDTMKANSPELQFDLDPLPEMEKRKRAAAQGDRTWGLAPIIGRTGADFERTLLLTLSGAMNQLRYLEGELAKAEVSDARREQLKRMKPDLDDRYTDIVDLLNLEYFVHFSDRLTSEQAQAQSDGEPKPKENSDQNPDDATEKDASTNDEGEKSDKKNAASDDDSSNQTDASQATPSPDDNAVNNSSGAADTQPQPQPNEEETQYFGPRSR